ncbi:MAG: hypothetical protein ABI468_10415 [Candidatus Nanopelagicales bacterium]
MDEDRGPGAELVPARRQVPKLPAVISVPLDVVIGAVALVGGPATRVAAEVVHVVSPTVTAVLGVVARPPFVPAAWTAQSLLGALERRGRAVRRNLDREARAGAGLAADTVVPSVLDLVLDRMDLTGLVLSRVDLSVLATAVLDQLDLTEVVLRRVDLGEVVGAALDELDLTEVVLTRVSLGQVVAAALDAIDLTEVVLTRVDLGQVVNAALDSVDLTEIVRSRVDLPGLADEVIDEVDLPEIIRESSSGVATDVVNGARMGAIDADDRISRLVDRLLLRRRERDITAPDDADAKDPR